MSVTTASRTQERQFRDDPSPDKKYSPRGQRSESSALSVVTKTETEGKFHLEVSPEH